VSVEVLAAVAEEPCAMVCDTVLLGVLFLKLTRTTGISSLGPRAPTSSPWRLLNWDCLTLKRGALQPFEPSGITCMIIHYHILEELNLQFLFSLVVSEALQLFDYFFGSLNTLIN
jgi:hypothetical protein